MSLTISPMAAISAEELKRLEQAVASRLGARSDAAVLVRAFVDGTTRTALVRTVGEGSVPTSLPMERSLILIEVSRELGRVIEDFEIQALFRVSPAQARAMRTALLATYPDVVNDLSLAWSVVDAFCDGRKKGRSWAGTVVVFAAEDRRNAFADYARRLGADVEELLGDAERPWRLLVSDTFPKGQLPR
jgi:hypothetical protein